MPRKPRIDSPGCLYHVMARGIERRSIFDDECDCEVFLGRLGRILQETGTDIYAYALIPNHFHLLLRRCDVPISRIMQRLLTSYAIYFNKRHKRCGHLFQNRYKSIICDEDTYLLELVRYINLNPLRSRLVRSLRELSSYHYCSHGLITGNRRREWFDPGKVLSFFGSRESSARRAYLRFIQEAVTQGTREELEGGGLKRSLGFPDVYPAEKEAFDDRILGLGDFVRQFRSLETEQKEDLETGAKKLIMFVCCEQGVGIAELLGKSRRRQVSIARARAAQGLQAKLGMSISEIARELAVTPSAVNRMFEKISAGSE